METRSMKFRCACGGGQSCIVDRRKARDWVHEDDVFKAAGVPLRKHCMQAYLPRQEAALQKSMGKQTTKCNGTLECECDECALANAIMSYFN